MTDATIEKSPADVVISTFGGITATARATDNPITTVQGWKDRKKVPQEHWATIIRAAKSGGKKITLAQLAGIEAA